MVMTNEDIIKEFREAAVPTKQIAILADQNLCSKQEIADILIAGGCDVPGWYKQKKSQKEPKKEAPKKEKAPDQTEEVYDGKGNVILPVTAWIDIIRMRVEFEHILSQPDAYGILSAVEAVRKIREARA